jgi:GT2 family glycosyltransferase
LRTIREHSSDYRVIFVDNGSRAEEFQAIYDVLKDMPHHLVRNTTNLGFVKATNQGLALSTAPYVVLMNNDTEAVPRWLEKLEHPLHIPGVVMAGPRTTATGSWQGRVRPCGECLIGTNQMLAFFCTMFNRLIFRVCGYLDEDFGVGFGEDDWYCWNVHRQGYRMALVGDLCIPHHHRSTFKTIYGDRVQSMLEQNAQVFFSKVESSVAAPRSSDRSGGVRAS